MQVSPNTNQNAEPCSSTCHLKAALLPRVVPPRGAVLGRSSHPERSGVRARGPTRLGSGDAPAGGAPVPPAAPPSSSTFPVKTNPWGRGRRRPSPVPGKPRQQTQTHASGRARRPPRPGPPTPAGPGVAGGRGALSGPGGRGAARGAVAGPSPAGCKPRPRGATPPPPGPEARGHPDTRRGHSVPAPRSHAGRRFEVSQGDGGARSGALTPPAPESHDRVPRWVEGGPRAAPGRGVGLHWPGPVTSEPATPSPMDTHRVRRGGRRRTQATRVRPGRGSSGVPSRAPRSTSKTHRPNNPQPPSNPPAGPHAVFKGPGGTPRRQPRRSRGTGGRGEAARGTGEIRVTLGSDSSALADLTYCRAAVLMCGWKTPGRARIDGVLHARGSRPPRRLRVVRSGAC